MAETAVVETPIVQTPVTTPVVNPPVETTPAPEVDLLTKVSQFKLPEEPVKIENPPEQPELASITDPVAKKAATEAVERIRRGLQSQKDKEVQAAQSLINQSKDWTPDRIQNELLTNPKFLAAAQMIQGTQQTTDPKITQEEYSALTDTEKAKLNQVIKLEAELNNLKQTANDTQIRNAIIQKDLTLRTKFPDYDTKQIDESVALLSKSNIADVREYVYKAVNYESNIKKAYEMGKLEGQGKLQTKINTIAPQGSTVTSQEGVPTKVAGESDKAFFVRLGQFRLAQFKNQK